MRTLQALLQLIDAGDLLVYELLILENAIKLLACTAVWPSTHALVVNYGMQSDLQQSYLKLIGGNASCPVFHTDKSGHAQRGVRPAYVRAFCPLSAAVKALCTFQSASAVWLQSVAHVDQELHVQDSEQPLHISLCNGNARRAFCPLQTAQQLCRSSW